MQNFLLRWNMEGCSRSGCACEDCEALCEEEVMTGFLRGLQSYSQSALMMAVPMCDSGIRWRPFFFATSPILLNLAACTIKGQTRLSHQTFRDRLGPEYCKISWRDSRSAFHLPAACPSPAPRSRNCPRWRRPRAWYRTPCCVFGDVAKLRQDQQ